MRLRLAAFALCGLVHTAYAAHPLITDDTGTQDAGNSQLEINTDRLRQRPYSSNVGNVTYTYGATANLDLFFNAPVTLSSPSGINDVALGAKWRFYERDGTSFALEPSILLPSGDEKKSLGTGKAGAAVTLIGNWERGPWTLHGNLAISVSPYKLPADRDANRNTLWRVSAAARYALTEQWQLVGDIGVLRDSDPNSNGHPAYFLTGAIYSPLPTLDLDAGLRFGIGCAACVAQVHRQFGVGLTWRF